MELEAIKTSTTWNDAAQGINSNFAKLQQAVLLLEEAGGGLDESALVEFLEQNGYATVAQVAVQITEIVGGASTAYNTLKKLEDAIKTNAISITSIEETLTNSFAPLEERVAKIESWFALSEDGETLVTEKNLASTGQVSSGGIAEEGGGGGDGSGSISGASDAAISNQQDGDIIVWQESAEKWVNKRGMYHHVQSTPLQMWEIQHNMGKFPNVKIVDSSKQLCMADIYYVDENNIRIEFGGAESGDAYLD